MAEYPGSAYTPNPQDTSNDLPGNTQVANGADYNKHDEEIQAISGDLRGAIAAGTGSTMAAVITDLAARQVITTPGVGNTTPGDLALWDDTDGTALRMGNDINGPISVSNETVNALVLGEGELISTNGNLAIKGENALFLESVNDVLVFSDAAERDPSTVYDGGTLTLTNGPSTWSVLQNTFIRGTPGTTGLLTMIHMAAVGGTGRALVNEDFYGDLDALRWSITGGSFTQTGQDAPGGVTEFGSGSGAVVQIETARRILRRDCAAMADVRFLLNDITDVLFQIAITGAGGEFTMLQFDSAASANFQALTANPSTTSVDTGLAAATGTWYRLIIQESDSDVVFRLGQDDGNDYPDIRATITTTLPTATLVRKFRLLMEDTAASSKSFQVDWVRLACDREA